MATIHLVFGPQGAGKSTSARELAGRVNGVHLAIDDWMAVSRADYASRAAADGHASRLHFVSAPRDVRRTRVLARNAARGETFAFEVTPAMFDFMEREFEPPTQGELADALVFESH